MKTDMNPHAVTLRLQQTSDLRDLCIALGGRRLKQKIEAKYGVLNEEDRSRDDTKQTRK